MKTPMLAAALLLLLSPVAARADADVTACTSDTQAGAGMNLAQALAIGGVIRFRCPAGSVIRVTGRYTLAGSTLIDGGDAVTLRRALRAFGPVLSTPQNTNIILRRITLRGFLLPPVRVAPAHPGQPNIVSTIGRVRLGSVLNASGDAELDHVTIETSEDPISVIGTATVRDSTFVDNRGYALDLGTARVERSRFRGNSSALSMAAGWVRRSDFTGQTAGAIRVGPANGPVEIRHSTFASTRGGPALALSQRAGRDGPQTVTVRANVFRDNEGGAGGGAIHLFDIVQEARDRGMSAVASGLATLPPAGFVLAYNQFVGNHGARGGAIAADLAQTGGMVSTGDLFVANVANGDGGAVAVSGGALRVSHALFKANRAGGRGAAVFLEADAQATLSNALVIGNAGPAGAITSFDSNPVIRPARRDGVVLANVTIADNDAVGLLLAGASGRVANAIFARNRPADCARVSGAASLAFQGGNLQSDGSCPGVPVGDAYLDAFYVPAIGSPALRAGDPAVCAAGPVAGFDLPFQGRLDPTACALGAFEHAPVRRLSRPTDRREPHATAQEDFSDDEGYRPPPALPGGSTGPTAPPQTSPSDLSDGGQGSTAPPSTFPPTSDGGSP